MASGYKVLGVDLDDIFDPYVEGTKPAATGFMVGSVDIIHRYAPLSYGAKRSTPTGITVKGVDLRELFAAKGTAVYATLNIPLILLSSSSYPPVGNAHCAAYFMSDGTVKGYVNNPQGQQLSLGTWISGGNPADFEFRFTKTAGNDPSSGTFGVWQPATDNPGVGFDLYTSGARYVEFTVECRRIGTGTPSASRSGHRFDLIYSSDPGGGVVT